MRKCEYFTLQPLKHQEIISNPPKKMYPQERDWTCSMACIRTMLSGIDPTVPEEDHFVSTYRLTPGPLFSKDIKKLDILGNYDALYGCDKPDITFDSILDYMENGYFVMLESMLNFSHWFVLLGYYPSADNDAEKGKVLVYDPYYNTSRLLIADEFIQMWIDGNHNINKIQKDFIAVRGK